MVGSYGLTQVELAIYSFFSIEMHLMQKEDEIGEYFEI